MVLFFFQAEDGIRDYKVTGVQTCALPISPLMRGTTPGKTVFYSIRAQAAGLIPTVRPSHPGAFRGSAARSEERRVGKEGRSRWSPHHLKKKKETSSGETRAGGETTADWRP